MKRGFWDSEANKFTLYGAVFGLLFPIIATVIQSYMRSGALTWEAIVAVQRTDPLLWIIDSAPFFLGLFARFAGWRQDQLKRIIQQNMSNVEIEADRLEDARQFAGVLTFLGAALICVVLFLAIIWLQSLISTTLAELPPTAPATVNEAAAVVPATATTVAVAPQVVVINAPTATPVQAAAVITAALATATSVAPTLPPATPTAVLVAPIATDTTAPPTVAPTPTPSLDGVRLGLVERSDANCAFFTEVASAAWQQLLGVNVQVERFATVDALYAALTDPAAANPIALTLCYVDPADRTYLRQYPGELSLVGKAFWQTDTNKLFAVRGRFTPPLAEREQRCINNFLANQSYSDGNALQMAPDAWLAANTEQVNSWLNCAAE